MAEKGWICLYRKIQDDWLWKDKPFSRGQAWIDLILLANHQEKKFLLGNELQEVKRGEFITSIRKLSERWGWSRNKTKMFLDLLESDQKIVKNSDTKKTTINIVKYSDYQDLQDTEKATKKPRKGHVRDTTGTRVDTNNNDNNDNNVNNGTMYINLSFIDEVVDNVHISQEQYDKLLIKFGKDLVHKNIIALDNYIANNTKGKGYKDHYRALNTWCSKDASESKKQQKTYGKKESNFNNFEQRDYDFEDLERKLLGWDEGECKE